MKKYLLSIFFAVMALTFPAAAVDLFPVDAVSADGYTSWGYMAEDGTQAIPYQYASASAFTEDGLATVTSDSGSLAVIDETGRQVVPFRAAPTAVEYDQTTIAFRYEGETVFFDKQGGLLGTFAGASGFFSEEGLLSVQRDGVWGYVNGQDEAVIAPQYRAAGPFSGGYAVVQRIDQGYAVIDAAGNETPLPTSGTPKYLEVYGGKLVIMESGSRLAVYSLETGALLSDYLYQEISPYRDGYAMMRLNNRWGIVNLNGVTTLPFSYNYLSYMGDGVYAARGDDGYVSALDADGNIIYRTDVYAGGFDSIEHGVSWHGTMDNGVIFFSGVGGYITKLANAENPTVLTNDVALVTIAGKRQYIRLSDRTSLYSPEREYDMGYFRVTTTRYEKYLGMKNGVEYGWSLTYPVISGLADKTVQAKVNNAIETFFLEGPSFSAQREALTGSYGLRVQGRLLVVWADCVSGIGEGASVWNDNITLDLATGERYWLVRDLFTKDYVDTVTEFLPQNIPFYLFSYPRITDSGVSFFLSTAQAGTQRAPSSQEYTIPFAQLEGVINKDGECWRALNGAAIGALNTYADYSDVPQNHWAYGAIKAVTEADLMHGDSSRFRPDEPITIAEAAAVMVRALEIDTSTISPPDGAAWYYIETTAAANAGLTAGLDEPVNYTAAMTRADAMQIIANTLQKQGAQALSDDEIAACLSRFYDSGEVPQNRRAAAALCVQTGTIVGSNGRLDVGSIFTRAQFAQILSGLLPAEGTAE